jgi:hypothetical protein
MEVLQREEELTGSSQVCSLGTGKIERSAEAFRVQKHLIIIPPEKHNV